MKSNCRCSIYLSNICSPSQSEYCPLFCDCEVMIHRVALADSTGGGAKQEQFNNSAEIVLDTSRQQINMISPGACLCSPGVHESQPSLTSLIANAHQAIGSADAKRSLQLLLTQERPVKVIFVKAEDSIPWTSAIAKRFKAMVQYRQDLELPETSFNIMSLFEEFELTGLYDKNNPTHFTPAIARKAL